MVNGTSVFELLSSTVTVLLAWKLPNVTAKKKNVKDTKAHYSNTDKGNYSRQLELFKENNTIWTREYPKKDIKHQSPNDGFWSAVSIGMSRPTGVQWNWEEQQSIMTELKTTHALCRITSMLYPIPFWRVIFKIFYEVGFPNNIP